MAMEVKMLEVKNSEEASVVEFWAQFGWNLKSSQRIYNKDSHLEKKGDTVCSVTETVDFTKIILERDKNNPNYSKIVSLENEYFSIKSSLPKTPPKVENYTSKYDWISKAKPNVITNKFKKAMFYIMLICGIVLVAFLEQFDSAVTMTLQVVGAVMIVMSFIVNSIFKKQAIKKALDETDMDAAKKLDELYKKQCEKSMKEQEEFDKYDRAVKRMPAIIEELKDLI